MKWDWTKWEWTKLLWMKCLWTNENGWRWIRRSRCQRIGYWKKWELDDLDLEEMGMDIWLIPLDHVTYYIQPEIKQSSIISIINIILYNGETLLQNTSGDQCWTEVSKINHWTCRRNFVSRTDFNHFICYAMINEFCHFLNSRRLYNFCSTNVYSVSALPRNYLPVSICQCTVFLHNSRQKWSTSGFRRF